MTSPEVLVLAIGGITASILYISRHLITSKCWTKEECCAIKLRRNSQSRLSAVINEEPSTPKEHVPEINPKPYEPPPIPPPVFISSVV